MTDKCVIMTMEEIEQMFLQIERRIGVHERDVMILEERCKMAESYKLGNIVIPDEFLNPNWLRDKTMDYRDQREEETEQVEAPRVIEEGTGGEDDPIHNSTES